MTRRLAPAAALALLGTACGPVKQSYVRPDYEQAGAQQVKRLAVVTQPLPAGSPVVGELWSLIARQWVNQNRNFLVKSNVALPERPTDPTFKALCVEGIEGVLWLEPDVKPAGKGVEAAVKAHLVRCSDGSDEWSAEAGGSWSSDDDLYRERTAQYVQQFGEEVQPFVVPTYKLLKATLDTLPNPQLTEADIEEKIELGE
ncbi:MXAN_6521/LA_1396 family lipoprotein [Myxococcaceae bacterium GXIMD 01537]